MWIVNLAKESLLESLAEAKSQGAEEAKNPAREAEKSRVVGESRH